MSQSWSPESLEGQADPATTRVPRCRAPGQGRADPRRIPAAGLRRRGSRAAPAVRRSHRRTRLLAPGRGLRGKLRRIFRGEDPRYLQGTVADGGGNDLRRRLPGSEGRAHGRPVRQAALLRRRNAERRDPARLSRRHRQRHRLRREEPRAGPGAPVAGLPPVHRQPQPVARLRPGRLRRPAPGAPLEPRFHRQLGAGRALPATRRPHRRDPRLHARLRPGQCAAASAKPASSPPTKRSC